MTRKVELIPKRKRVEIGNIAAVGLIIVFVLAVLGKLVEKVLG